MSNLMNVAKATARGRPTNLAYIEARDPRLTSELLNVTDHYKSIDRNIRAGCDLFHSGDRGEGIYSLVEGWVALYNLLEDGGRQILQFGVPGTILAFVAKPGAAVSCSAQALTDALISIVPHNRLEALFREHPKVGMQLAGLITQDRSLAYDHLSSLGRRSARERVAHLLLELFIRCRMQWPGQRGEEMYLPLTQEHIGDATGLTGVHVNRVLQDLRKRGVLEFHYRRLRVLNPDKLVEIAKIDPHVALSWTGNPSSNANATSHHRSNLVNGHIRERIYAT